MASLEFIRTRPEELGGGVETIPRNFIGQPISGIIGNRWKSSFRRLCLLLASLDWVPPLYLSFSPGLLSRSMFSILFLRHARFPPSYVCVRVHTLWGGKGWFWLGGKGKKGVKRKHRGRDDDGCSVCFNRLF